MAVMFVTVRRTRCGDRGDSGGAGGGFAGDLFAGVAAFRYFCSRDCRGRRS